MHSMERLEACQHVMQPAYAPSGIHSYAQCLQRWPWQSSNARPSLHCSAARCAEPLLTPTCAAAGLAAPQYTTFLTCPFTCGSAAARLAILSDATNTIVASEWVTMYSMAFSPNESYNGTQYSDMRLHACTPAVQQHV
jgi:hypothetical protein